MLGSRKALILGGVVGLLALSGVAIMATSAPAQDGQALPEGDGKFSTEAQCGFCHDPSLINRSMGYTRENWNEFVSNMAPADTSTQSQIVEYLAQNFPPSHNQRPATLVSGPLQVTFQDWIAPTPGQGVRGPAQAPDGKIWWVGQRNNNIGRVDPATGERREWALPDESGPDSVTIDAHGGIWYTGNGNQTIGRFDPEAGRATEIRMSDPAARGPLSAEFDRSGIMWFTLESGNMIGRLDPSNGQMRYARVATADARPFGIKIAADGTPWATCSTSNCLIRVNPQTMALTEVRLPAGANPRRLDIAADGAIWYTNFSQGKIGRYDPATNQTREWNSPSGANSQPYAIAIVNGIVWYNESGVRPDALVRFDPRNESFQSWAIQSGPLQAGIVRQMRATADGHLLLHQDATNRIILATLPPAG